MIPRQHDDERLGHHAPIGQIFREPLWAHECGVEPAPHQLSSQVRRVLAGDGEFHVGQLVVENTHRSWQPIDLHARQEAKRERRLERLGGPARRFDRRLGVAERKPRVIEKGVARGCEFHAAHAAPHQQDADLIFEVAHLAAERRLRRVQPLLGRDRQAPFVGDSDEIAKMSELHRQVPCLRGMTKGLQSSFLRRQRVSRKALVWRPASSFILVRQRDAILNSPSSLMNWRLCDSHAPRISTATGTMT